MARPAYFANLSAADFAKTLRTLRTKQGNPATKRIYSRLELRTKWEQTGNKVRTVLYSERNSYFSYYFCLSPAFPAPALRHFLRLFRVCPSAGLAGWLCTLLELGAKGPSPGTIPSRGSVFALLDVGVISTNVCTLTARPARPAWPAPPARSAPLAWTNQFRNRIATNCRNQTDTVLTAAFVACG